LKGSRSAGAAWLVAVGAAALAGAADPSAPEPAPDAELLEFLGSDDGTDDVWTQFLAWLEAAADPKLEPPAPEAEGETDE
jgi:hypothetical protein